MLHIGCETRAPIWDNESSFCISRVSDPMQEHECQYGHRGKVVVNEIVARLSRGELVEHVLEPVSTVPAVAHEALETFGCILLVNRYKSRFLVHLEDVPGSLIHRVRAVGCAAVGGTRYHALQLNGLGDKEL